MFFVESHVPSPTTRVSDEYVLLPAGESESVMTARPPDWQQFRSRQSVSLYVIDAQYEEYSGPARGRGMLKAPKRLSQG